MNKTICGVVVDEKYFKEFMERKFKVLDKTVKANVVEIYATSRDYAENAPEYTEAAQKVREQIRAEIQAYYAAKDGRKEYKAMKHQNFGGYLEDLKELFLQASKEREVLKQKFDKAGETWKREEVETRGKEYEYTRARMDFLEAEEAYKNGVLELEKKYKKAVEDVRAEFENHLNDFYLPNGSRIDAATVALLNSGIKLKATELDQMLVQFSNSPTMLRILGDYSTKNGLDKESRAVSYSHVARGYGAGEKRIFNRVADFVNSTVELSKRRAWVLNEKGRDDGIRMIDGAINEMDTYFVRPQVYGE